MYICMSNVGHHQQHNLPLHGVSWADPNLKIQSEYAMLYIA